MVNSTPNELPAQARARHERACRAKEAGYIDPISGLFVLTSAYLLEQGECCGSGCRHCPWPADAQDEAGRDSRKPCWPWTPDT